MTMTKAQTVSFYAEQLVKRFQAEGLTEKLAMKIVKAQNEMFEDLIADTLQEEGKFTIPGILVVKAVFKPAVKGGKQVKSPFSGEMVTTKDKAETVKVKINGLKKLKDIALDSLPVLKKKARMEMKAAAAKADVKVVKKDAKKVESVKVAPKTVKKVAKTVDAKVVAKKVASKAK